MIILRSVLLPLSKACELSYRKIHRKISWLRFSVSFPTTKKNCKQFLFWICNCLRPFLGTCLLCVCSRTPQRTVFASGKPNVVFFFRLVFRLLLFCWCCVVDEFTNSLNRIVEVFYSLRTVSLLNFYEHSEEIAKVISSVNCHIVFVLILVLLVRVLSPPICDIFMCRSAKILLCRRCQRCSVHLLKSDNMKANSNMSRASLSTSHSH